MRAATPRGREQIEIERIPVPEPGPGEARVRIEACGICGSDLHLYQLGAQPPGIAPGHEMAGVIDALGDGCEGFASGERVAIEPLHSCGKCDACRAGRDPICREMQIFGIHRQGGFADYVTLPTRRLFRVPADLDPRLTALCEPMAVVIHGLRRGGLSPGGRVLVLGAGTVGLLAVQAARSLGASDVWLTARHPHQARVGAALGANRVLREKEATRETLAGLGAEAPIDLVIETVGGSADTLDLAAAAVRPGGAVSVVGVFMGPLTLEPLPWFLKEITMAWSNCYWHPHEGADFETAVRVVAEHREQLGLVTTHTAPLDEIQRAFALAGDKKSGAIKVTVSP